MIALLVSLVFTPAIAAEVRTPADCADYFRDLRAPTFEIDELSSRDLEIEAAVAPAMGHFVRTPYGRARLNYLLHPPFLDSRAILDRQRAVRVLADNTLLRRHLRADLNEIQRVLGGTLEEALAPLARDHRAAAPPWVQTLMPLLYAGISASGATVALGLGLMDVKLLLAGVLVNFSCAVGNSMSQDEERSFIRPFRRAFAAFERSAERLDGLDSPVLQVLGDGFASLKRGTRGRDLTELNRRVGRLSGTVGTFAGSLAWLTNRGTYRAREALLANLENLTGLFSLLGELDVLLGFAEQYDAHREEMVFPQILTAGHSTSVRIAGGHHPSLNPDVSVANDFALTRERDEARVLLFTGPKAGGKSTYLKMIGANVILAQIGAPVRASEMRLTPLALLTTTRVTDRLATGESLFTAQCRRVVDLLRRARSYPHALILADEMLGGAGPEEHRAVERAVVEEIAARRVLAVFATQDYAIQDIPDVLSATRNIHVAERGAHAFEVSEGPSHARNALEILAAAGAESSIVESARRYFQNNRPEIFK